MADEPKSPRRAAKLTHYVVNNIMGQFRYAAKHHSPREARELARRFREAGAFGLAV